MAHLREMKDEEALAVSFAIPTTHKWHTICNLFQWNPKLFHPQRRLKEREIKKKISYENDKSEEMWIWEDLRIGVCKCYPRSRWANIRWILWKFIFHRCHHFEGKERKRKENWEKKEKLFLLMSQSRHKLIFFFIL